MRFKLLLTLFAVIVAAALVRGAADTTKKQEPPVKEGFVDRTIDKVKEKMFGIPPKDVYRAEEHADETINTKVKSMLHSGKETIHHAHETVKKAEDVAGTAGVRAKDALLHKHTHDTFTDKVKEYLHPHDEESLTDVAKDKYEQAKDAAKDKYQQAKDAAKDTVVDAADQATRDPTMLDKVKDFLHLRKDPIDATADKLKEGAGRTFGSKSTTDAMIDKGKHMAEDARDAIKDAVRNTDYASDTNRDYDTTNRPTESLVDKVKDFLHINRGGATLPTAKEVSDMAKDLADRVKETADDTLGKKNVDNIIDKAKQLAEDAGDTIKEYAKDAEELVGGAILGNKAKDAVEDAKDAVKGAARDANRKILGDDTSGHAHDNVTLRPTMATTADESLVDKVKEYLRMKKVDSVVETAKDAVQAGYDAVKDKIGDADEKLMDKVKDFVQVARDDAEWVVDEVKNKANKLASDGRKKIDEMADSDDNIKTRAEDAKDAVLSAAQDTRDHTMDAAEWTKDRVNEGVDKAKVLFDTLKAKVGTTAEEMAARNRDGDEKVEQGREDLGTTNIIVDNKPDVQEVDTGKTLLGRAKDALKKCFTRSKTTNELIEVECAKDATDNTAYAGVYETAKEGVEDTVNAAKQGVRNTVNAAKEGAKNTAGAAKDAMRNKRVEA